MELLYFRLWKVLSKITMNQSDSLNIVSFNCRGFNSIKCEFIADNLTESADFIVLQEHWLGDQQVGVLGEISNRFLYTAVSGFHNEDILQGRPYGGCAILWRADLVGNVSVLSVNSNRVCALYFHTANYNILLVNVYMPYENNEASAAEFSDILSLIENLMNEYPDCHMIICGDFNVDFTRNRLHTTILDSFCDNLGLHPVVRHNKCRIDYSYHFSQSRFNILDHFLLSGALFETAVYDAAAIHSVDNLSDHEPIVLSLCLHSEYIGSVEKVFTTKPSWPKASENNKDVYRTHLDEQLRSIVLPLDALLCHNPHCNNSSHFQAISLFADNITQACITAAKKSIPLTSDRKVGKRIAGWSEHVQPLRDKALLWHHIWVQCNRPREGVVADTMRRARAAYHHAIKKVKRDADDVVKERVAASVLQDGGRNFWSEIKRIRNNKARPSSTIDGMSDPGDIAQLFASKYRELYNCVSYDKAELRSIIDEVNDMVSCDSICSKDFFYNIYDIKKSVARLKAGKKDGDSSLTSDHIINASDYFFVCLAFLFSAITVHGCATNNLLTSVIIPIPKGKNANVSSSVNYRGIALCSLVGKVFDYILLDRYQYALVSSELQFGFKAKSSTNICTMILKETVAYYTSNNSMVFCSFLDATKAFDRLQYCKLFRLLIARHLPPCVIRVLIHLYTHSLVCLSWSGVKSDYFVPTNGVKQGAVLSPVLFCIYIDNLLLLLAESGIGCFIGHQFVGTLAYADDIVLIAPTATALRKMLDICDNYAQRFDISFNASKSKWMVFVPSDRRHRDTRLDLCSFRVGGAVMERVNSVVYLGHVIPCDQRDDEDILKRRGDFIGQVNNLLCYFCKLDSAVRSRLFTSYCMSLYGAELWTLSNHRLNELCSSWRRALRSVWRLPYRTHNFLLPIINNCLPIFDELCRRNINFVRSCIVHSSVLVRFVSWHGLFFAPKSSFLCQNIRFCSQRYNTSTHELLYNCSFHKIVSNYYNNDTELSVLTCSPTVSLLLDLINMRDNPDWRIHKVDITYMIDFICTESY